MMNVQGKRWKEWRAAPLVGQVFGPGGSTVLVDSRLRDAAPAVNQVIAWPVRESINPP